MHQELKRVGVTLQLLWVEYQEAVRARNDGSEPYQYSQFCERYREWRKKLGVSLRQVHRAGEKAFVDFSGKKPRIIDRVTGEVREAELFVMTLGASNYTYAEATLTQKLADFVSATVRAFEYFGGVPEVLVPDQLRSAVSGPDRYDPDINSTYLEMAKHYGVAVVPARPGKPRDKAKVENAVLVVQRWIWRGSGIALSGASVSSTSRSQNWWRSSITGRFRSSKARAQAPSRASIDRCCDLCPLAATSSAYGPAPRYTSTTTSPLITASTACQSRSSVRAWKCARLNR